MTTFKSPKEHESIGSTKAETSGIPLGLRTLETQQAFGYSSYQSAEAELALKYPAMPKVEVVPKTVVRNGDVEIQVRSKEDDKGEGAVSKRLKEIMRLSGLQVGLAETHKEAMTPQGKEYNSLSLGFNQTQPSGGLGFVDDAEHRSLPGRNANLKAEETFLVAKYDFQGEKSKDLSFKKGEVVRLIDKKKNGWWLAEVDNRIGFVPSNYLCTKEEIESLIKN